MLEIVSVYLLAALCICALIYRRARLVESGAHPLPPAYPGLLPIIGHTYVLITDTSNLWRFVKKACEKCLQYGGVIHLIFGSEIYYFVTDPEDALVVANTCLKKHFMYSFIKYWLGEGLITGSGDHWQRHRQMLKSSFSLPIINGYIEVFNSQSRTLLSALEGSVGKGKIDSTQQILDFTLGSSYLTTFGKNASNEKFYPKYVKAVHEMLHLAIDRFQKFWLHNDLIHTLLGRKKYELELVKSVNEMSDEIIQRKRLFFNSTVTSTNELSPSSYTSYWPLLDLILEQHTRNSFTDQEINEELHTTVSAAFDTTFSSLTSTLVLIGSFPNVQEKMYEEVMEVVGTDRDLNKEDLPKLVYTKAVIKEALRLIPSVPVIARYIDRDVKLKNYTLRAGSQCIIAPYGVLRHPSWGPDAEQFRPERWLDPTTLPANHTTTDAAFSFGKRSCLGKTYAMTSMQIAVAHMVRKFIITADYTKMQFKLNVNLKAISGHEISLERRV